MEKIDYLLKDLRKQIDHIDQEIISLLWKRLRAVKKIWKLKKENNIPPLQTNRWNEVLKKVKTKAEKKWINSLFIEKIWNNIHEEALKIEK